MQSWILPTTLALACFGLWAFLPKLTVRYLDPKSALVFGTLGAVLVSVVVLAQMGFRAQAEPRGIVLAVLTAIFGFAGTLAYLYAAQRGPVALIATVTALYPVIAILLAVLVLNEPITLRQGLGMVLALVAIVLIGG